MLPSKFKLDCPYKAQQNFLKNDFSHSNCTNLAMALEYFGCKAVNPNKLLEKELQEWLESQGLDSENPQDLVQVVNAYGCRNTFTTIGSIDAVKEWLFRRNIAIIHGYFTRYGHTVCVIGYNPEGLIVHDPLGKYSEAGYDTSVSGAALTYSYQMIDRLCLKDGEFWVHFISK